MKKLILVLLLTFLIAPLAVSASEVNLNKFEAEDVFYRQTFDNLVLDFTVNADEALNTLAVKSSGTARFRYELDKVILWADAGEIGFDGFGIDEELAEGELDGSNWVFDDLNYQIDGEQRFFVTVETGRTTDNSRYFKYCLSSYDASENGEYDSGDMGIFLESGVVIHDETCGESSIYRSRSWESEVVIVVENLEDEQIVDAEDYTISGKSRVQGGYGVSSLSVCIDDVCQAVENTVGNHEEWEYEWTELNEGNYEVYAKAQSTSGAWSQTEVMNISVDFEDEEIVVEDESESEEIVESDEIETVESEEEVSEETVSEPVEIKRNLEAEVASLPVVIRILGHLPSTSSDWSVLRYLVYGLKIPGQIRDLSLERYALGEFGKMYARMPETDYEWNVIRVLAYFGMPGISLGR